MTSRRRFVAAAAAVAALAGALVLGGVTAANADGGLEFSYPADGASVAYTSTATVLTGVAPDLTPLNIWDYSNGGSPDPLCLGVVPAGDLTWSCADTLNAGPKDIRVEQQAGSLSDTVLFDVPLPTPTVTSSDTAYAGGTITLAGGNGYAGATITAVVTTPNEPGLTCSTGALGADGAWSGCNIPFDAELTAGTTATVTITQTYSTLTAATTYDVDIVAVPTFGVTAPTESGGVTWSSASTFEVRGTTPDGVPIVVDVDGTPCLAMITGFDWTCGASPYPAPGTRTLNVQHAGDTVDYSFDVRLPVPAVSGTTFTARAGTTQEFTGTTSYPGSSTRVTIAPDVEGSPFGVAADTTCPDVAGSWSCTVSIPSDVPPGSYLVVFEHFDPVDSSIRAAEGTYPLTMDPPPGPAPLDCAFVPGGVTVTSPDVVEKDVYRLTPYSGSGGGAGGGGSEEPGGYTLQPQGYCNGDPGYGDPSVTAWDDQIVLACGTGACSLTDLAPGIYEVYYRLATGQPNPNAYGTGHYDYLFRVPETPAMTGVVSTANSVVIRGEATTGDAIRVVRSNGTTLCTTTVTGAGTWACQFPRSSATSARVIATDPQSGGLSAYSASRSIPVFVAPETPVTPDADPPLTLVSWFLEFGGDLMNLKPGDSFILNVSGMPEGTEIEVWMHSTPRLIGTATGTGLPMSLELTVPEDIENGPHEIEMIGVTPLGTQYFFTSDAMVTGGVDPGTVVDEEPVGEDDGSTGGGSVDRADPAAPSALSESIPPLERIIANPVTIAIAGGLALALLFLVALPTELLNSSLSSNTSRLGRVYGRIDGAMSKAQDWFIQVTRSRALAAALITVIVAIVYGFIDPGFGFDVVSLRLVLSLALAFFILSYGASWLSGFVIRRLWGTSAVIAIQPSIILFAVVGVIVARILDFSPGFLIGIAIGLELISASRRVSARAVLVQFLFVVGLSLAAWVAYSLFTPGNDFAGMLVEDTLVAVTAEGLTGALIAVFPLQFMDGRELWLDSKRLWVGAFLLVAVPFSLLVLPTAVEGTEVGDYGIWLLVFAVFGLISVAIWLVFARAAKREEERVAAEESVDA